MRPAAWAWGIVVGVIVCGVALDSLSAQMSFGRLRDAWTEPENWLTYSGSYFS